MTVLHAGGKFDDNLWVSVACTGGIGGQRVVLNTAADHPSKGELFEQTYSHGVPETLKVVGETARRTAVFYASPETFSNIVFHYDVLEALRELAFLNSGVRILLKDEARVKSCLLRGWPQSLRGVPESKQDAVPGCASAAADDGVEVDRLMERRFQEGYTATNNIPQRDGGTHLAGFGQPY